MAPIIRFTPLSAALWVHRWRLVAELPKVHPLAKALREPVPHAFDRDPDGAVRDSRDAIVYLEHVAARWLDNAERTAEVGALLAAERTLLGVIEQHLDSARARRRRRLLAGLELRENLTSRCGSVAQLFAKAKPAKPPQTLVPAEEGNPS